MGREIVYCNLCGVRIVEDDLLKGRALTLLDKVFCAGCKAKAFSQMRPDAEGGDDRTLAPPPAELMEGGDDEVLDEQEVTESYDEPETRPAARGRSAVRTAPAERPPVRRKQSMLPIAIGGFVGFVATVVLLVILLKRADVNKPPRPGPGGGTVNNGGGRANEADAAARKAMTELEKLLNTTATHEQILAKCSEIESVVKGTDSVERFNEIRREAETARDRAARSKSFTELFDRAKTAAAADKGTYARYAEITKMFEDAREMAINSAPERAFEIKEALEAYADPYELEAKTAADEIAPVAHRLAGERRWKDAIKIIDAKFPTKYMQSRAWKQLKTQREQYEVQARNNPGGPNPPKTSDPVDWKGFFRRGDNSLNARDWRKAREDYLRGLQLLPPFSNLTADEKKAVASTEYNLACTFFIEGKAASGDAKAKANDKGFEYLNKSITDGLPTLVCNCHNTGGFAEHVAKDEDLDGVRDDQRYKDALKKLQRK